jgi:hypothetical protein
MTTQLIILPNGTHAREINDIPKPILGESDKDNPYYQQILDLHEISMLCWNKIESSLKEYQIINIVKPVIGEDHIIAYKQDPEGWLREIKLGEIVTCEVNQEEGTCKII